MNTLFQASQEIQITRDSLLREVSMNWFTIPHTSNANYTSIPVRRPNDTIPTTYAIIDQEDLPTVQNYVWRLSTSGHILSTKNGVTTYLHRLIFGGTSRHISGNRMDNRRQNLQASKPRGIMLKFSSNHSKTCS